MAPAPGRKADEDGPTDFPLLFAFGRFVGFTVLAGVALAILATLILLPAYARLSAAQYELDCRKAQIADEETQIAYNERYRSATTQDPVLVKRLAMSQFNLKPRDEVVVAPPGAAAPPPPGAVPPRRHPRPSPPDNLLLRTAAKVETPSTRRGLFLTAAGAMLAAMFLFAAPDNRPKE
jgi:hypothetical protein